MIYDFDALKVIFEQIPASCVEKTVQTVNGHERIFLYGAGRSGLMLRAFAMRLSQTGRTVYVVGETVTPAIKENDLLILASASGKTPSVLRCAQTAKEVGATVYALTASYDSELAARSDAVVVLPSPTKDSASTTSIMGTLFEQSVLLFCDATVEALGEDAEQMRARHANLE